MEEFSSSFSKIDFREKERDIDRGRNINFFYSFMYSLVSSYMCPVQGSNLQPWTIRMALQPTKLVLCFYFKLFLFFNQLTYIILLVSEVHPSD